jgi:long-chain acyl-CoA synthetase
MEKPKCVFDLIYWQQSHFPQEKAFTYRHNGVELATYSTKDIIEKANQVSQGLLALGLRPGDKVASIIVKNRPEWVMLDIGMMQIGVINVPVYPTISAFEYEYIFNEAAVKYCFIGDDNEGILIKKLNQVKNTIPSLSTIYTFDKTEGLPFWEVIFKNDITLQSKVDRIKNTIRPDDLLTIIYTSGTTGQPKGVMLSHHNLVFIITTMMPLSPLVAGDRSLSFLPLNHIFEKAMTYGYIYTGVNVVQTGTDNLGGDTGDLKAVKPHFFTTVPRLLEKVYEKIYNKGLELRGVKRALFFWALNMADTYEYDKKYTGFSALKFKIADALVFKKWREALGGCIKGIVVAASPCPVKIAKVFSAAGIPIREAYGMTELSPGVSINLFTKNGAQLGTVGPIIDNIDVIIDPTDGNYTEGEGEILVAGDNVMMGYYNNPDETAKVIKYIDGKRWMCTGDIGKLEAHNGIKFLKITDRKKELFKTSGGKYVAPAPIENKFRENFLIEQIMVVGDNQKFVSALIVPAVEALKDWCQQHNITWTNMKEIIANQEVIKKYNDVVEKYNDLLGHVDQIKAFRLVTDTWEPVKADGSSGELTPTMKLKRRVLLEKYRGVIDEIYNIP